MGKHLLSILSFIGMTLLVLILTAVAYLLLGPLWWVSGILGVFLFGVWCVWTFFAWLFNRL